MFKITWDIGIFLISKTRNEDSHTKYQYLHSVNKITFQILILDAIYFSQMKRACKTKRVVYMVGNMIQNALK